jgi:hypothetical protein
MPLALALLLVPLLLRGLALLLLGLLCPWVRERGAQPVEAQGPAHGVNSQQRRQLVCWIEGLLKVHLHWVVAAVPWRSLQEVAHRRQHMGLVGIGLPVGARSLGWSGWRCTDQAGHV